MSDAPKSLHRAASEETLSQASPEIQRLAALARYHLDENTLLAESSFGRLAEMAARLYSVKAALISFVGDGWQWWGAGCGLAEMQAEMQLPEHGMPVSESLCRPVVQSGAPLTLPDLAQNPDYAQHPLARQGVRFYAGTPLRTPEGHTIGTLCLLDTVPHAALTDQEQQTLHDLAALIMDELELRLLALRLERQSNASERLSENLRESLVNAETLQAISALGELGLGDLGLEGRNANDAKLATTASTGAASAPDLPGLSISHLLLQAVALCAAACDVELGSLVAIHEDRAFIFPAWNSPSAAQIAARVSRGIKRDDCELIWSTAFSGVQEAVFVNDYASKPGAHLGMAQAGTRAQAYAQVGQRGEVRFLAVFSRLHRDRPWRPHQRSLISSVAGLLRNLSRQRLQQDALKASTAQLELALDSAALGLFQLDRAGVFQMVRGSRVETSAWGPLLGRAAAEVFASVPQALAQVQRALAGESFDAVLHLGRQMFEMRYLPLKDVHGEPAGALGMSYDVTRRVHAEQQALQARQEAEALLELAQAVTGDLLDPRSTPR